MQYGVAEPTLTQVIRQGSLAGPHPASLIGAMLGAGFAPAGFLVAEGVGLVIGVGVAVAEGDGETSAVGVAEGEFAASLDAV